MVAKCNYLPQTSPPGAAAWTSRPRSQQPWWAERLACPLPRPTGTGALAAHLLRCAREVTRLLGFLVKTRELETRGTEAPPSLGAGPFGPGGACPT